MDQNLIYFLPFIVVGLGMMLAPFVSDQWPDWLVNFAEFCAEMSNGVWIAGVALVILISLSVPVSAAALLSLPVMYFAGRYFARTSEWMDERTREMKRQGWEAHQKREEEARKSKK